MNHSYLNRASIIIRYDRYCFQDTDGQTKLKIWLCIVYAMHIYYDTTGPRQVPRTCLFIVFKVIITPITTIEASILHIYYSSNGINT